MREADLLEQAWGIIANAGGGNWGLESPAWQTAAVRFREAYHAHLSVAKDSDTPERDREIEDIESYETRAVKDLHWTAEPPKPERPIPEGHTPLSDALMEEPHSHYAEQRGRTADE